MFRACYALITNAALGDDLLAGGLSAILTQTSSHNVIAYASRKLQKHEANYTPFLLEMQAAIWGMKHLRVNNSFYTQTTNLLKNLEKCTPELSIGSKN
jgi:hypothetical protein